MTGEFAIAVHALVYLNHKKMTVSSENLAENICTNPARVRKVMAKLKKAKLIVTKEGLDGGYRIDKSPDDISLRQICNAVSAEFVCSSWKSGDSNVSCMISSGMASILDNIYGELNELCKSRLEHITIADIDNKIFGR